VYPPVSGRLAGYLERLDLQVFCGIKVCTAASLKIVVSPVRFRPSPFSGFPARAALFGPIWRVEKMDLSATSADEVLLRS
jgi:hypothetical protein